MQGLLGVAARRRGMPLRPPRCTHAGPSTVCRRVVAHLISCPSTSLAPGPLFRNSFYLQSLGKLCIHFPRKVLQLRIGHMTQFKSMRQNGKSPWVCDGQEERDSEKTCFLDCNPNKAHFFLISLLCPFVSASSCGRR